MAETDPRFKLISAQKFIQIDTSRVPEVRSWVDPRDLAEPKAEPLPEPVSPEPAPVAVVEEPKAPPPPTSANPVKNTPNRRGQMIGDKKVDGGGPKPVLDPWETKKPPEKKTEGKVVQPGAKIRLGGS
jgi:hypothetical protein